jgi:outer membrane protein OmpA-like peptidoglycan-associated protein
LVNQAVFLEEMRERKSPLEALLGRYDQSLREIAALMGVTFDRELSGTPAAEALYRTLREARLQRQVLIDSLSLANRHLTGTVGRRAAEQDSIITVLQIENSAMRQQLWETQLRVGVAEADRSAAESELKQRRRYAEVAAQLEIEIGADGGEVLLTPDGAIVARMFGFGFATGSAELHEGSRALIAALARAILEFPNAAVRVEGHTDDTGSRSANLRLSRRRAETVAASLARELGIDAATITTSGYGPDRPIATNASAEGRALNRRIDVVIVPAR